MGPRGDGGRGERRSDTVIMKLFNSKEGNLTNSSYRRARLLWINEQPITRYQSPFYQPPEIGKSSKRQSEGESGTGKRQGDNWAYVKNGDQSEKE